MREEQQDDVCENNSQNGVAVSLQVIKDASQFWRGLEIILDLIAEEICDEERSTEHEANR